MRRAAGRAGSIVFVDAMVFRMTVPLPPGHVDDLGLSTLPAGVLRGAALGPTLGTATRAATT
ncbi:hypothetical protein Gocc_0711 [Gaiella occulta]|uniref:Uncharacterized protein n=1 Tax=Gaiella occulta TaxID=1002870 RepID=A0A7M2YZH2_9ACTN|nr:hypothetical protein [Gaiella occulta]RDI74913.1 hypothetical protein Gocc_0711 [Gaiella occulta]